MLPASRGTRPGSWVRSQSALELADQGFELNLERRVVEVAVHGGDISGGLFHGSVGEQAAIDAGGGGVPRQALQSVADHRVEVGEQQQRDIGTLAYPGGDREHG